MTDLGKGCLRHSTADTCARTTGLPERRTVGISVPRAEEGDETPLPDTFAAIHGYPHVTASLFSPKDFNGLVAGGTSVSTIPWSATGQSLTGR
jgi:hypothetical protein